VTLDVAVGDFFWLDALTVVVLVMINCELKY